MGRLSREHACPAHEADLIAAAERLLPQVLAARDECDHLCHLLPRLADALADAGLLQMYLPRALGGREASPLTAFHVVETIARADGATGWCSMISSVQSAYTGWLPVEAARAMAGTPANLRLAGSFRALGRATPVAGGYIVNGRWDFASGVNYANWLVSPCVIMDGREPRQLADGVPLTRKMWIPASQARIDETWNVVGLRGTGSHDYVVGDLFVPEAHTSPPNGRSEQAGPHYDARLHTTWAWTATCAAAIGIARGAMDAFVDLATRPTTSSSTALRDRSLVQAATAEAEAMMNSARYYVIETVGEAWDRASAGETDLDGAITQARLAITHSMHLARRAVDRLFHAAGTHAIYKRSPLERSFRDIHVAIQHGSALIAHYESAGKALLGVRPTEPGW